MAATCSQCGAPLTMDEVQSVLMAGRFAHGLVKTIVKEVDRRMAAENESAFESWRTEDERAARIESENVQLAQIAQLREENRQLRERLEKSRTPVRNGHRTLREITGRPKHASGATDPATVRYLEEQAR